MHDALTAAIGRRKIWQGHDERDEMYCREGAYQLFDVLTDAEEESLDLAAEMVKDAFWLADEAESYQDENEELEGRMYRRATRLLKEARGQVGLPYEPMEHRGNGWWKAYRRDSNFGVVSGLFREQVSQFGLGFDAVRSTLEHLDAARNGHDDDDWSYVDDALHDHYGRVLDNL